MTQPPTPVAINHPGYESDPTGQTGPPNKRSKITATLWEDEKTLCFQVEANGICVARRAGEKAKVPIERKYIVANSYVKTTATSMAPNYSTWLI